MWRRLSSHVRTLAAAAAAAPSPNLRRSSAAAAASVAATTRAFSSETIISKKKVEDVMPIATGHEREELEAELQGRKVVDIDNPEGPFGTKDAPAIIKSYYDKRIVGCPGGEGEDEHDVVWFWLEKGKPHECPVCTQYFEGGGGRKEGTGSENLVFLKFFLFG